MTRSTSLPRSSQSGISLVIVMIFLAILSVLGITAMQGSTLSSRIARNEADRNLAFQAAEAAMRDAQLDIKGMRYDNAACVPGSAGCRAERISRKDNFTDACTDGLCNPSSPGSAPVWESTAKWASGGGSVPYGTFTGAPSLPTVSQQPRYLLEVFITALGEIVIYRITAIGYGANSSTQIMLQTAVIGKNV